MSGGIGEETGQERGERLQARLARAGVASRRASEALITAGRVRVDGRVVTELGTRVLPEQRIEFDGKLLGGPESLRRIALNKPAGYVCTMSDPEGRPTAASLLGEGVRERVYNVGRLDAWSSGLILFTNDGELARIAGHPSGGLEKEYQVEVDAHVPSAFPRAFERGIEEGGEILRASRVIVESERRLRVILVEGRNREIRRALGVYGLRALKLVRVRIGSILLGTLAEGTWRELDESEIRSILDAGARKASTHHSGEAEN